MHPLKIALALAGAGALAAPAAADVHRTVSISERDSGHSVAIVRGDRLVVRLKVSTGTGYSWRSIAKPGPALERISARLIGPPAGSPPGSQATKEFVYRGAAAGTAKLKIGFYPPARGAKAVKVFRLTVRVR